MADLSVRDLVVEYATSGYKLRPIDGLDVEAESGSVVVSRGKIVMLRDRDDGGQDELAVFSTGDHFGEMGPLFSLPRSATAVARGKTTVTGYTVRQFREMVGFDRLPELIRGDPKPRRPKR